MWGSPVVLFLFQWIGLKIAIWVHPQFGLLCGACSLPIMFVLEKQNLFENTHYGFPMVFAQHVPNLLLTRGTTIKTGMLTLIAMWWVP